MVFAFLLKGAQKYKKFSKAPSVPHVHNLGARAIGSKFHKYRKLSAQSDPIIREK